MTERTEKRCPCGQLVWAVWGDGKSAQGFLANPHQCAEMGGRWVGMRWQLDAATFTPSSE